MYDIVYSEKAEEDLAKLRRSEPAAFKKAVKLLNELVYHPRIGTGHLCLEARYQERRFTDAAPFQRYR
jgi:mRNA-degrading endonuclease RelE of RelBE toxin-antitoxin system